MDGGSKVGGVRQVAVDLGGAEVSGGGFADEGVEGFAEAVSGSIEFEDGGLANGFFGVPWHVDEEAIGNFAVAVGFEGENHFEVAASEGDDGGEEGALGVALGEGIDIGRIVAVFVEPDDDAVVTELFFDFFFEGSGD